MDRVDLLIKLLQYVGLLVVVVIVMLTLLFMFDTSIVSEFHAMEQLSVGTQK